MIGAVTAAVMLTAVLVPRFAWAEDDEESPLPGQPGDGEWPGGDKPSPAEMTRYAGISELPQVLYDKVTAHPNFAGMFIEGRAGVVLVVRTTGDPAEFEAMVAEYLGPNVSIVIQPAPYTLAELELLMDVVVADIEKWRSEGIEITMVDGSEVDNRTLIGLENYTPEHAARLIDAYGPRVSVQYQAPLRALPGWADADAEPEPVESDQASIP